MLKLFEMFGGYGGASFGLKKANIPFECVGYSEIDKNAIKCYEQNFKGVENFGDCTKIEPEDLPDFDLLTGGFPCQDVSIAGHRDLSKGRTNLYTEILRIAEAKKPKYVLLENVKGLLSMEVDEVKLVSIIVRDLKKLGYGVAWKVLNSKDYGTPQNRERVWFVCKLGGWGFMEFQFPNPVELKIFVKDILEKEVDKKYLLSEKQVKVIWERLRLQRERGNGFGEMPVDSDGTMTTLTSRDYKDGGKRIKIDRIQFDVSGKGYDSQQDRIYNSEGVMCCLPNANPDNKVNIFALRSYPRTGTKEQDGDRFQNPEIRLDECSNTLTGVEKDNLVMDNRYKDKGRIYEGVSPTLNSHGDTQGGITTPLVMNCLTEAQGRQGSSSEFLKACETVSNALYGFEHGTHKHFNEILPNTMMIFRRLTPKECFRLMGFLDDEINLEGLSDTQKYRLAGNGWDINLVSLIFKNMFKQDRMSEKHGKKQ